MPHESTVAHEQRFQANDGPISTRSRASSIQAEVEVPQNRRSRVLERSNSTLPHIRAETPRQVTHHHDDDDSEKESDKSM